MKETVSVAKDVLVDFDRRVYIDRAVAPATNFALDRFANTFWNYHILERATRVGNTVRTRREHIEFNGDQVVDIDVCLPGPLKGKRAVSASVSGILATGYLNPRGAIGGGREYSLMQSLMSNGLAVHFTSGDSRGWGYLAVTDASVKSDDRPIRPHENVFPDSMYLQANIRRGDNPRSVAFHGEKFAQLVEATGEEFDQTLARIIAIPEHLLLMGSGVRAALDGTAANEYLPSLL